jgi:hypothetical protein
VRSYRMRAAARKVGRQAGYSRRPLSLISLLHAAFCEPCFGYLASAAGRAVGRRSGVLSAGRAVGRVLRRRLWALWRRSGVLSAGRAVGRERVAGRLAQGFPAARGDWPKAPAALPHFPEVALP